MASLADRTAVVTGASRGIGLEIARALRTSGARVAMVARGEEALQREADRLGGLAVPTDVSSTRGTDVLRAAVDGWLDGGAPDILVNCAGTFELAPVAETDPDMFDRQIGGNLRGPFLVIRAFLPAMLERGSGHIVSIGSVAGRRAFPNNGAYSASKFGLRGLHEVLAEETRGTGVRSTLVEPAATDTSLWDALEPDEDPGLPSRQAMLSPGAVANAVLYALSQPAAVDVRTIAIQRS